ncbi:MAG: hypothetical protein CUR34_06590 [Sediminibacterium sp.]|nr:MAG: hypothetical protein CUR34_06590 [Sediminibacterium sp.] [Sediminibacterium sp. FEMGT703S]
MISANILKEIQDRCIYEMIQARDHLQYPFLYGKYALINTNPEPENDIHIVFDCVKKLNEFPLVAIGKWDANPYAKALYKKYADCNLIQMINSNIEWRTYNMFRSNCFIYIDANHKKNDSIKLLEAMYMQLPIITYADYNNLKLTNQQGWYYTNGIDLKIILKSLHQTNTAQNGLLMKQLFSCQQEKLDLIH